MEPYLSEVSNFRYRKSISKIRTSSHSLAIEKMRHSKNIIPFGERLCHLIEDEQHFLTSCVIYSEERKELYKNLGLLDRNESRNNH